MKLRRRGLPRERHRADDDRNRRRVLQAVRKPLWARRHNTRLLRVDKEHGDGGVHPEEQNCGQDVRKRDARGGHGVLKANGGALQNRRAAAAVARGTDAAFVLQKEGDIPQ